MASFCSYSGDKGPILLWKTFPKITGKEKKLHPPAVKNLWLFIYSHMWKSIVGLQIFYIIMNHDSGFIIGIAMIFCQNFNRAYT